MLKLAYIRVTSTCTFRRRLKRVLKGAVISSLLMFVLLLVVLSTEQSCAENGCGRKSGMFVTKYYSKNVRPSSNVKRILKWTGFFEDMTWEATDDSYFSRCEEHRCTMTNERRLLDQSDAVLFHVGALWNIWRGTSLPNRRHPYQRWILYNVEPPPRVPLDLSHYAGVFNWTAFYRRDSDIPVSYGGIHRVPRPPTLFVNKLQGTSWYRENNRFAAWMSSNCHDHNRRGIIIRELKQLLGDDLDLYGTCGGKRCPETICSETLSNYKFFFTFENSNCRDYITEKFWSALQRRQIPVVLGGASPHDYHKIAPPGSFIHVNDYKSLKSLVDHLRYLSTNETAYNSYLAWSLEMDVYSELSARRKWWCDVCAALHNTTLPDQVYTDIAGWAEDDVCPLWSISNQLSRWIDGIKIRIGLL